MLPNFGPPGDHETNARQVNSAAMHRQPSASRPSEAVSTIPLGTVVAKYGRPILELEEAVGKDQPRFERLMFNILAASIDSGIVTSTACCGSHRDLQDFVCEFGCLMNQTCFQIHSLD